MNVTMDKVIDVDLDVNGETVTVSSVLLGVPHTEVFCGRHHESTGYNTRSNS